MITTWQSFCRELQARTPDELVRDLLYRDPIALFQSSADYEQFKARLKKEFPAADAVFVMGSANLGYSLSPDNFGGPFSEKSDVDVVLISEQLFQECWAHLRGFHRAHFYSLDFQSRQNLRRNGENVYAGFASPSWIPAKIHKIRRDFDRLMNRLSDASVGYRQINALFFRDEIETLDYYKRSLMALLRKLCSTT